MTGEQKVYVLMASLLSLVIFAATADMIYTNYDEKRPHYEVGTCLKQTNREANEFEKAQYTYIVIAEVGKERYRYIRIFEVGDLTPKKWSSYEDVDKFVSIDKYTTVNVVHCSEIRILLGLK
jgi:hypothetical protein